MKKTKAQVLIQLFHYWCGRLKLKPVELIKDNRQDCPLSVSNWDEVNKIAVRYHTRRLGQKDYFVFIGDMFHEIGHLIHNLPYDTYEEKKYSEYKAEMFGLKMMRKHYPEEYTKLIQKFIKKQTMTKFKKGDKQDRLYYDSWIKIKVYRDTIK